MVILPSAWPTGLDGRKLDRWQLGLKFSPNLLLPKGWGILVPGIQVYFLLSAYN